LGHASDIDGWLAATEMPQHFRPQHLGRAPARFEVSQLMHWQKESLERLSATEFRAWLAADDSIEFIDLVRHNVILPADADSWRRVVNGDLEPLGAEAYLYLTTGKSPFIARVSNHDQIEINQDIELVFNMQKAHIFDKETEKCLTN